MFICLYKVFFLYQCWSLHSMNGFRMKIQQARLIMRKLEMLGRSHDKTHEERSHEEIEDKTTC